VVQTIQRLSSSVDLSSDVFLDGYERSVETSALSPTLSGSSVRTATLYDARGFAVQQSAAFENPTASSTVRRSSSSGVSACSSPKALPAVTTTLSNETAPDSD
jgi:hypothetical protein